MNIFNPSVLILDSCQADTKPEPGPRVGIRQPYHFDPGQPHHQPETRFKTKGEAQCRGSVTYFPADFLPCYTKKLAYYP